MVSGAIPGQKFPKIVTEEGAENIRNALPDLGFYRTPDGGYVFNEFVPPPSGLLADPVIQSAGPRTVTAVPFGNNNTGAERTGVLSPAVNLGPETASEQYMREMKAEAPIVTPSPDTALKRGLIAGEGIGLLGDINWKGLMDKLLQTFQRPEMLTPGVNALTSFGMSGAALNQDQIAGAAAEQARMDKFALAQLKNAPVAPGAPKPSAEITNLYKEMGTYQTGLNTFDRIKGILSSGIGTGGVGSVLSGLNNIAAAFNINLTPSAQKTRTGV
jgi:hypothetical protein